MAPEFTPLQQQLLESFFSEFAGDGFFLSGGSALSWGYLHHRLSEDLDFFCRAEVDLDQIEERWQARMRELGHLGRVAQSSATFRRFAISTRDESEATIVDLVTGDPPAVGQPTLRDGVPIDSLLDLAVNKIVALNREEIKDFVDLYLIFERFDLDVLELLERAKTKTADADSDWFPLEVADLLTRARTIPNLSRLRLLIPVDRYRLNERLALEGRKIFAMFRV